MREESSGETQTKRRNRRTKPLRNLISSVTFLNETFTFRRTQLILVLKLRKIHSTIESAECKTRKSKLLLQLLLCKSTRNCCTLMASTYADLSEDSENVMHSHKRL